MAATAYPAFIDALADALRERGALDGVNVFTAPVDPGDLGQQSIMFADDVPVERELAAMGSTDESETFSASAWITCYGAMAAGADKVATINAAAKTVRDRACAILDEVTTCLSEDRTVAGTVLDADVSAISITQGMAPEGQLGRWCAVQFTVSAEAHTTP